MTRYLLAVVTPAEGTPPTGEEIKKIVADCQAWTDEAQAAGVWVFSGGLHAPDTATVLRPKDGDVLVTDGPFAEGKEYIGGFSVIDVPDLDAALDWGRRHALATTLPTEVRPFVDGPPA